MGLIPFDPVNIIWSTKAQIFLYKTIGVKTNMNKHDEKKQGIAKCVSKRKCVNEKEYKIREKTKENKASPRAHTLLYRG